MSKPRRWQKTVPDEGDRQTLNNEGIGSLDDAWREIAKGGDKAQRLLRAPGVPGPRLVHDLIAAASREADTEKKSWLGRYWPDLLLAALLVAVVVLVGRAFWPLAGGSSRASAVAIALRDLRAGDPLHREDLHAAAGLDLPAEKSPGPALRLTADVPRGGYVFPETLERYEVVALREIPAGAAIPSDAVRQKWNPYRRQPAALWEQIVGNRAARTIRQGATLRPGDVESASVLVDQVVASRPLARLHRIEAADLHLERRPRQAGALLSVAAAVGRYPWEEVEAGSALTEKGLSPRALPPGELNGRQLLTLRVQPPSFRLMPQLPARVSLAVAAARDARSLLLSGVPVLAVDTGANGPAVVVALDMGEIQRLLPLLPDAQVYVLQEVP